VAPAQVVVGNGSNELIHAISRAVRPRCVAIAEPTYTEYLRASLLVGAEVDHWLAEGDAFAFEPFDLAGVDLVWLCNPNNPTGALLQRDLQIGLWVEAHPATIFVVDEAFLPFAMMLWPPAMESALAQHFSAISLVERFPNLVVLRSLTKLYALPGIRVGYAVASPGMASRIREQIPTWSVNVLAQAAGLTAIDDPEYKMRTRQWLDRRTIGLPFVDALLAASPVLHPLLSAATFFLVRLEGTTADRLCAQLAEHGITVRNASNFVGLDERYVRIGIRTAPENERLFDALQTILAHEGA
jgi:threonine-phosphate decarboxylase